MKRTPSKTPEVTDLTTPVPPRDKVKGPECLGKEYDPRTLECSRCADNELCAIYFRELTDKRAKELRGDKPFLDEADLTAVTDADIAAYCIDNDGTSVAGLIEWLMSRTKFDDRTAINQRIIRFKTADQRLKIITGTIVWKG